MILPVKLNEILDLGYANIERLYCKKAISWLASGGAGDYVRGRQNVADEEAANGQ